LEVDEEILNKRISTEDAIDCVKNPFIRMSKLLNKKYDKSWNLCLENHDFPK